MKQTTKVKNYMTNMGSITSLQAIRDLGITRLAAVILLIKKEGVEIDTEMITVKNRDGDNCHVARYSFAKKGQQELFE